MSSAAPPGRAPWRWLLPAGVALAAMAWLARFPVQPVLLGLGLLAAAAVVAWRPVAVFALALAAMPVLDLAPWSGRSGLDEFDLLLALACSVAWARLPRQAAPRWPAGVPLLVAGLALAVAASLARALWPWPAWAPDAFDQPLGAFNALRLAKGAVWALLLWALARRWQAAGADVTGALGRGLVVGLAGTVLWVLAERLAFSGLGDFAGDYRVAGPFAAMSLGGAYVECFLVVATPFVLMRLLPPAPAWRQGSGALLLAGTSYALAVTFSRGGYAALAVGVVVWLAATWLPSGRRLQHGLAGFAMLGLVAAVAYPVLSGSFARSRLAAVSSDLGVRERHWAESLQAMGDGPLAQALGMGLGRYAATSFWTQPADRRPGGHQLLPDGQGGTLLRLGAGSSYYVEQIVPVQAGAPYRLTLRAHLPAGASAPGVALCQKWIIASFDCSRPVAVPAASPAAAPPAADGWQTLVLDLAAPAAGPGPLPRPVRLSLYNPGRAPLDIAQVSLVDANGAEQLHNGRFAQGLDRWTITSDQHLAWHTKSLPLGLYFELGGLGVLAFGALLLAGAWRAALAARAGQPAGAALLAALCAFSTVGLVDTLIDAPRFLMLWLLLCLWPLLPAAPPRSG